MSSLLRVSAVFLFAAASLHAAPPTKPKPSPAPAKPEPVDTPPILSAAVPAPAYMDVVEFEYFSEGDGQKVTVTTTPGIQRVDESKDGYSILYNPQTDFYTGLEHRNYTYWEFSWPDVRMSVENSKRGAKHLQDMSFLGLGSEPPRVDPSAPTTTSAGGNGDDSGYVWKPTKETKRISDLDCEKWTGESISGQTVQAWCTAGGDAKVDAAIALLRRINEPMALVPVRSLVPPFIFPVYDALLKGGVTPVLITWGDDHNKNHFRFIEAKRRDGQAKLFAVPKLYVKTTLVTMDGMTDAQPSPDLRGTRTPPRVDHSNPNPVPTPGQSQ